MEGNKRKFCNNCGEKLDDGSTFCKSCGKQLSGINTLKSDNNSFIGGNKVLIGVIIVIVIAISIVGIFAVMSFNDNSNNNSPNNADVNLGTNNGDMVSVTSSSIPLSDVRGLAQKYLDSSMPASLEYQGVTFTRQQCLYIFAKAIDMKDRGLAGDIKFKSFGSPDNPSVGQADSREFFKDLELGDMARRTISWMDNNGRAPNYMGIWVAGDKDIGYYTLVQKFASVIISY
ncbi:MAG: zinc-ribbon domain-containing protein [Methanobacteriaceae archaeon]